MKVRTFNDDKQFSAQLIVDIEGRTSSEGADRAKRRKDEMFFCSEGMYVRRVTRGTTQVCTELEPYVRTWYVLGEGLFELSSDTFDLFCGKKHHNMHASTWHNPSTKQSKQNP